MCSSFLTLCSFCSEQEMFQYSLSFCVFFFPNIQVSLYPIWFFPVVIDGSSAWCCPAWVFTECTWLQANLVFLKTKIFKPVSNTENVCVLALGCFMISLYLSKGHFEVMLLGEVILGNIFILFIFCVTLCFQQSVLFLVTRLLWMRTVPVSCPNTPCWMTLQNVYLSVRVGLVS